MDRNYKKIALLLGSIGFFILFLSLPSNSHAQTLPPVKEKIRVETLTPANGWNCEKNDLKQITKCTNTNGSTSKFYKATAVCQTPNSFTNDPIGMSVPITLCEATLQDGARVTSADTLVGGVSATANSESDSEGNQIASDLKTSGGLSSGKCSSAWSLLNPFDWGTCIVKAVGSMILLLANFLLGTAGILLNWVVIKTVFQFGSLIGNSPGILTAWGIMRDIANMILLFGFILMGLGTILDLHSFPTRKAIPRLLIFAVLMNFSLFAAEGIIDVSNGLSSVMYSQANTDPCVSLGTQDATAASQTNESCAANYGIAGHIMQSTGLSTVFNTNGSFGAEFTTYIMLALFATIGAVVLFAASIMLIIRLIVLSFLMVSAPIGFAGMAIPPLQGMAKKWWSKLLSESFFAPVLFLLILVSLKITHSFSGGTNSSLAAAVTRPGSSVMGIIMVFMIVIGFMIASLIAAKSVGASGAGFAVKTAGRLTYGSMGFVGRRTVGTGSGWAAKKIRSSRFGETDTGRRISTFIGKGAESSFDFRASKAGIAGAKFAKLDLGSPGKNAAKGIKEIEKKASEQKVAYAKTLVMTKEEEQRDKELKFSKESVDSAWKDQKKKLAAEEALLRNRIASDSSGEKRRAFIEKIEAKKTESGAALSRGDFSAASAAANEAKELEVALNAHEEQAKQDVQDLENSKDKYLHAETQYNEKVESIQKQIEQNSPQGRYASNIQNKGWSGPFIGKRVNNSAVKEIRGELKKSKSDKDRERIIKALEHGGEEATRIKNEMKEDAKHSNDNKSADNAGAAHAN